jgi:uncharacterized protein YraI
MNVKKMFSVVIILTAVIFTLIPVSSPVQAVGHERINAIEFVDVGFGWTLNLRAGAGINHSVIASIPNGTKLHIQYAKGNWAFTYFSGRAGWVSRDFLSAVNPGDVVGPNSNRGQWLRNLAGTPAVDWGNAAGTQCVELPKWYAQQVSGVYNRTVGLGNGNTVASGIAAHHGWNYSTDKNDIKTGDIVSFNGTSSNSWSAQYGHAVIVIEVSGGVFKYIEQWAGSQTIRTGSAAVGRSDIAGRVRPPA